MTVRVGVVGLGGMGQTHLDVYAAREDVEIVAVADRDESRLQGKVKAEGNIEGQAQGGADLTNAKKYTDAADLIADPDVDLIDLCLPTPGHLPLGLQAIASGKHVMIEKPLARTSADAYQLADAAEATDKVVFVGMCMRFWPGWVWLKDAVDAQTYGKLISATFTRVTSHPKGPFYANGDACGGAVMDLHVHDADFVQYAFGKPTAVQSFGYARHTGETDHLVTRYRCPTDGPAGPGADGNGPMIVAEGGWTLSEGFGFRMRYTVNFENATADFDIGRDDQLLLSTPEHDKPQPVGLPSGMGYEHEIAYMIECIKAGRKPETVTVRSAADAVAVVQAEAESVKSGRTVEVSYA